jgi:hypothetical protein
MKEANYQTAFTSSSGAREDGSIVAVAKASTEAPFSLALSPSRARLGM